MANSGQSFGYGSLIGMGIGTVISAFGSIGLASKQNAIAQSQANIARLNAQQALFASQLRMRAQENDQVRLTLKAGQTKSSQRAAIAANGLQTNVGSAAEMLASTDIIKEIDSNQIRENALRESWGFRSQATNFEAQALSAEASKTSKGSAFGTTLLQGASQIANAYMVYGSMGLFDENQSSGQLMNGGLREGPGFGLRAGPGFGLRGSMSF